MWVVHIGGVFRWGSGRRSNGEWLDKLGVYEEPECVFCKRMVRAQRRESC